MRRVKREDVARTAKAMGVSVEVAAAYLNGATVRRNDPKPKLACALLARFQPKGKM